MFVIKLRHSLSLVRNLQKLHFILPTSSIPGNNSVFLSKQTNLFASTSRSIFTDESLGLHKRLKSANIQDKSQLKQTIEDTYTKNGIKSVFLDDIYKLISLASTDEDFDLLLKILKDILRSEIQPQGMAGVFPVFIAQCVRKSQMVQAKKLWHDSEFVSADFRNFKKLRLNYMVLLYRAGCFQELIDVYKSITTASYIEQALCIAAFMCMGTHDALLEAKEVFNDPKVVGSTLHRTFHHYAYLACKRKSLQSSSVDKNLKLLILIQVGRIHDAIQLVHSEFISSQNAQAGKGVFICEDVMSKLTEAVRATKDQGLLEDLKNACVALDSSDVNLGKITTEQLLLYPISLKSVRSKSEKHESDPIKTSKSQL